MTQKTGPLLWTKWGQEGPYNNKLNGYYTGCVATAVAQIMAYHRHPVQSPSGNGASFTWNEYQSHQYNNWSPLAKESIGVLFKELGQPNNLNMNYGPTSSGATNTSVPRTFINFGYNCSSVQNYNYNTASFSIRSKKPVYISGTSDANVGHAWVVDGTYTMALYQYKYINFYNANQLVWSAVINRKELVRLGGEFLNHNFGWDGYKNNWIHSVHTGWFDYKHNVKLIYPSR